MDEQTGIIPICFIKILKRILDKFDDILNIYGYFNPCSGMNVFGSYIRFDMMYVLYDSYKVLLKLWHKLN